jgi:hypothetical protein
VHVRNPRLPWGAPYLYKDTADDAAALHVVARLGWLR